MCNLHLDFSKSIKIYHLENVYAYSTYPLPITYMYMYKILSILRSCGVKVYYNLGQSVAQITVVSL